MRKHERRDGLVPIEVWVTPKQKRYLDELALLKQRPRNYIIRAIIEDHRVKHK